MRKTTLATLAFFPLALAAMAVAAPPEGKGGGKGGGGGDGDPPTADFVPEYAGSRTGARNKPDTIIMANSDASEEVVIHSTNEDILSLDLSRDDKGLIAFSTLEGNVYLQRWSVGGSFAPQSPKLVHSTSSGLSVIEVDFSSDGTRLAFIATTGPTLGDRTLYSCSVQGDSCTAAVAENGLDGWKISNVRFDPTDSSNSVVLVEGRPANAGGTADSIYKYSLGSNLPPNPAVPFISTASNGGFDVGRRGATTPPLVVMASSTGQALFFDIGSGVQQSVSFAGVGVDYRFNCNNDALLYTELGSKGGSFIAVTPLGGGAVEKLTSKGWNSKRHDYMPRVSCE